MATLLSSIGESGFVEDYLSTVPPCIYDDEYTPDIDLALSGVVETTQLWNNIEQNMMEEEINYYNENGQLIIWEANLVHGFFDRIIGWFKSLWSKISGLFERFFKWVREKIGTNKKWIKKYEGAIKEGYKKLNGNLKFGTAYDFANIDKISYNVDELKGLMDKFAKNGPDPSTQDADRRGATNRYRNDPGKYKEEICDLARGKMLGKNSPIDAKNFVSDLKEFLYGKKYEDGYIPNALCIPEKIIAEVRNADKTMDEAKKAYANIKKSINEMIKKVKEYQKACSKDSSKNEEDVAYYKQLAMIMKSTGEIFHVANGVHISALKAQLAQDKAIGVALSKLGGSADSTADKEAQDKAALSGNKGSSSSSNSNDYDEEPIEGTAESFGFNFGLDDIIL